MSKPVDRAAATARVLAAVEALGEASYSDLYRTAFPDTRGGGMLYPILADLVARRVLACGPAWRRWRNPASGTEHWRQAMVYRLRDGDDDGSGTSVP